MSIINLYIKRQKTLYYDTIQDEGFSKPDIAPTNA